MKKLEIKGFIAGILVMLMLSGVTALAAARTESIQVTFNNIRLVVNGTPITPRDGAGNVVEPFIWNGTTYLPVRAVASALGQEVEWDGNTQTVYIGNSGTTTAQPAPEPEPTPAPIAEKGPLTEVATLVRRQENRSGDTWTSHSTVIDGETYNSVLNFRRRPRGFGSGAHSRYAVYALNGQYNTLNGHVGWVSGTGDARHRVNVVLNFIGDGRVIGSIDVSHSSPALPYSVNVSGVQELQIQMRFPENGECVYAMSGILE